MSGTIFIFGHVTNKGDALYTSENIICLQRIIFQSVRGLLRSRWELKQKANKHTNLF